jgi:hypothetical protein
VAPNVLLDEGSIVVHERRIPQDRDCVGEEGWIGELQRRGQPVGRT